jgi:hypothetical protein
MGAIPPREMKPLKVIKSNDWKNGITVGLANALWSREINSKEEALEAFKSGDILRTRNYGWKKHAELAVWLGLPEPKKTSLQTYDYWYRHIRNKN